MNIIRFQDIESKFKVVNYDFQVVRLIINILLSLILF